ncbi:TonB family protein [Hymenobacter gummosus]|uniref:TonB family protein n=1 Tax=Hymenobacter gummosus TaxID=1776032 RepID=A0A431U3L8_9BACT|nr:TonB family protein [Hymenobacter gummosus]RTQ50041.1 TonB family protein [Hymenobacter gummosus]
MRYQTIALLLGLLVPAAVRAQSAPPALKPGNNKYERGQLREGRPVGRWEYFDEDGRPELTFDYDSSRIVFVQPDTGRYWLQTASGWQLLRPARPPRLLGSRGRDMYRLGTTMRYPIQALRERRQGSVLITFVVGPDGQPRDFLVERSLSPECDREAWRVLSQNFDYWIPAVHLGRPVAAKFYMQFTFRIGQAALPPAPPPAPEYGHFLGELVIAAHGSR